MKQNLKFVFISLALFTSAFSAMALKPTHKIADQGEKINLEVLIPKQFGNWRLDESIVPLLANPQQQALLDKLYNQTLSRTYFNDQGNRIMLSIAYGGDQSDNMQMHKPEVCYAAQGFQIHHVNKTELDTVYGLLPAKHVIAVQGSRHEAITYWTTVGDQVISSDIKRKLAQMKYAFTGHIPDGLLFRVSSIQDDTQQAYAEQNKFVNDLFLALDEPSRIRLAGKPAPLATVQ